MLADVEDGKDESQHVGDEMIQQRPIAVVDLDQSMRRRLREPLREIEEVEIQALVHVEHVGVLKDVVMDPFLFGKRREHMH